MRRAENLRSGCFPDGRRLDRQCPPQRSGTPRNLKEVLGNAAWARLPEAVRVRFTDTAHAVDYVGEFETVRASLLGKVIAWTCQLIGTPVAPRTGSNVPAIVHVGPSRRGTQWVREYQWPGHSPCTVRSTKVIAPDGTLVEELPAHLCMSLDVYEATGVLHFVSRDYYFDIMIPGTRRRMRFVLPLWLSPGATHVEHIDEANGWFRFTMTTIHPVFGEMFFQTGRFHALGG
jgi:Domain of unknown function (DUF4166)